MIYHHLQALSKLSGKYNVRNVFLHGSYDEADFLPFIDSVISKFDFNTELEAEVFKFFVIYKHKSKS